MTLKLNGTNSEAAPAYAGDDADTGLQCGTNELKLVTGGTARATVDSSGTVKIVSGTLELGVEDSTNGIVNAPESLFFNIDSNNDSTAENFVFGKNRTSSSGGTELMRLDESGRLNINATTNSYTGARLQVNESVGSFFVTQNSHLLLQNKNSSTTNWWNIAPRDDGTLTVGNGAPGSTGIVTDRKLTIKNNGVVLVGKTTENHNTNGVELKSNGGGNGQIVATNSNLCIRVNRHTSTGEVIQMMKSGTIVGRISVSGSSTVYNTTSDYRLKENVVDLNGAIDRVKQLAPKRFNFTVEPGVTVDGFLAHEAQTVVPEAVDGAHNGVEVWKEGEELPDGVSVGDNKLDEDGNTIPYYQGIDQSKLVPLLTAALQEAIAKIETLETKVAALEAAS